RLRLRLALLLLLSLLLLLLLAHAELVVPRRVGVARREPERLAERARRAFVLLRAEERLAGVVRRVGGDVPAPAPPRALERGDRLLVLASVRERGPEVVRAGRVLRGEPELAREAARRLLRVLRLERLLPLQRLAPRARERRA